MPAQRGPYNEGGVNTPVHTPDQLDQGDKDLVEVPRPDQSEHMLTVYGHGSRMLDLFHSGMPMKHRETVENRGDHVLNISLRDAMRTDGERTAAAINLELSQLMVMNVFALVHAHRLPADQRSRVIRSKMFLKQKLHPDGTPDKSKARFVAGGDQQDKEHRRCTSTHETGCHSVVATGKTGSGVWEILGRPRMHRSAKRSSRDRNVGLSILATYRFVFLVTKSSA